MKKCSILLAGLLFVFGCGVNQCQSKKAVVLAKVNNYEITRVEFEEEFRRSRFGLADTLESRRQFLNNLINQKLILQEAQKEGLDKDPGFLKLIERFWEQSLLKITLDKKSREFTSPKEMDNWITQLNKKASITINQDLLKENK